MLGVAGVPQDAGHEMAGAHLEQGWLLQRGANPQPGGRLIRLGTFPGMVLSSSRTTLMTGIEPIRPCVCGPALDSLA